MKYRAAYAPLALAVLFGLLISLVPASPALGRSIPACQGPITSAAPVKLGGRPITPSLILLAGANGPQPCAPSDTVINLLSLSHTIVVSPVGTAIQNGQALLAAMTLISNATPSLTNPWLLKLEPGQYDLSSQSLAMLPYVDLEGSGEDTTLLSSAAGSNGAVPNTGTLIGASNSQVRFIKIANTGLNTQQAAVFVPAQATTNVTFLHLSTIAHGDVNGSKYYGLYNAGTAKVENSTLSATGASINYSLFNSSEGTISLENSTLSTIGIGNDYGLVNSGQANVQNSTLLASGGNPVLGLSNSGTVMVQNSTITASGGNLNVSTSFGLSNNDGTVMVQNSTLSANGSSASYGLGNNSSAGIVTVSNSSLTASGGASDNEGISNKSEAVVIVQNSSLIASGNSTLNYGLLNLGGQATVGGSRLNGSKGPSSGVVACPASFTLSSPNNNFVPLNSSCQ